MPLRETTICEIKAEELRNAHLVIWGIIKLARKERRPWTDQENELATKKLEEADTCTKILRGS